MTLFPPRAPMRPAPSLLACPAWARLLGAGAIAAALWGAVAWAAALP